MDKTPYIEIVGNLTRPKFFRVNAISRQGIKQCWGEYDFKAEALEIAKSIPAGEVDSIYVQAV